jgi:hypothetical protein
MKLKYIALLIVALLVMKALLHTKLEFFEDLVKPGQRKNPMSEFLQEDEFSQGSQGTFEGNDDSMHTMFMLNG